MPGEQIVDDELLPIGRPPQDSVDLHMRDTCRPILYELCVDGVEERGLDGPQCPAPLRECRPWARRIEHCPLQTSALGTVALVQLSAQRRVGSEPSGEPC